MPHSTASGRGCPPGDPRLSPLVAASPQAPSWHHRPGGCFLRGWGFGARGNRAPSQPQSCRAETWEGSPKIQGAGHRQHGDNAPQITPQHPNPTPTCTNWVPTGCHAARGRASPPLQAQRGQHRGWGPPSITRVGAGRPGSCWVGASPRSAAALGGGEPVRSALGARQGSAHRRHSAPSPGCRPERSPFFPPGGPGGGQVGAPGPPLAAMKGALCSSPGGLSGGARCGGCREQPRPLNRPPWIRLQ